MSKDEKKQSKSDVHNELEGFEIKINEFGQIVSSYEVDKLNTFLDEKVEDKKLKKNEPNEKAED